jgi:hypothetical protein
MPIRLRFFFWTINEMKSKTLASFVFTALLSTHFATAALTYTPVGPQTNVAVATVTGGGWRECYRDLYSNGATTVASILSQCAGNNLMMACRPTGNATLQLLAQAPRADVITDSRGSNRYGHQVLLLQQAHGFALIGRADAAA